MSANWSTIELECFPALLAYFGTDWEATATWIGTKSAAMVKGLYDRQVVKGREGWVNLARRAERGAREASGEAEGHPVMQNALAQAMAPVRRSSYGFSVNRPRSERVRRPGEGAGPLRSSSPVGRPGNAPASPPGMATSSVRMLLMWTKLRRILIRYRWTTKRLRRMGCYEPPAKEREPYVLWCMCQSKHDTSEQTQNGRRRYSTKHKS